MPNPKTTVVYLPMDEDTSDRWAMTAAALRAAGITDLRPAPPQSLSFKPKHARPSFISTMEV
jgi:hypothetical protein